MIHTSVWGINIYIYIEQYCARRQIMGGGNCGLFQADITPRSCGIITDRAISAVILQIVLFLFRQKIWRIVFGFILRKDMMDYFQNKVLAFFNKTEIQSALSMASDIAAMDCVKCPLYGIPTQDCPKIGNRVFKTVLDKGYTLLTRGTLYWGLRLGSAIDQNQVSPSPWLAFSTSRIHFLEDIGSLRKRQIVRLDSNQFF